MVNFISNLIESYNRAEIINLKNMESVSCPGINCIRGFIHLDCLRYHDQPISGSYKWTVVHPALKDHYKLGENNPHTGIPILAENSGNFAEQVFATCGEAKTKIYEQFTKALDTASKEVSLNEQHKITDRFPSSGEININYTNVGLIILAIALSGWGMWKCYRRLYPLQVEHSQQTSTKTKSL